MTRSRSKKGFHANVADDDKGSEQRETIMKSARVRFGDRWGKIEVVGVDEAFLPIVVDRGVRVEARVVLALLRCMGGDCGGVGCVRDFAVMFRDDPTKEALVLRPDLHPIMFPGKRVLRDCGCMSRAGLGAGVGVPSVSVQMNVSMPLYLHAKVDERAYHRVETQAEIMREMMTRGLREVERLGQGCLLGHLPVRGVGRVQINVKVNDMMMKRLREVSVKSGLPLSTTALALMELGLEQEEQDRDRQISEATGGKKVVGRKEG